MIGALLTFVLVTAVLTMLISGITRAIATANGNHTTATKARTGLLVALGTAILAGAGITWLNWLIALGDQFCTRSFRRPRSELTVCQRK